MGISLERKEKTGEFSMSPISINAVGQQVRDIVSGINVDEWSCQYWEQGECLALERLMLKSLVEECMRDVDGVGPKINRHFIPEHKKGSIIDLSRLRLSLHRSPPPSYYPHPPIGLLLRQVCF